MRYVKLGKTDLDVSTIAFGTWSFGGEWGRFDADEARATIHRALDLGITLFDTAQGYGFGSAERLLGEALWGRARRDDVIVATKGGLRMEGGRLLRDASRTWIRSGVESSLKNLRTDYIDLYQVHWPDNHTPAEETATALEELVREGKIRHAGVSNYDAQARAVTLPQLAVAWTLAHPAVHTAIVGARRPSHLEGTTSAADVDLSEEDLREIDDILSDAVPVWGPHPEGM